MNKLDYEKVFKTLVKETGDYVTSNHLQCMVLGISGGIDSTVVAAICHEVSKNIGIPLIGRSIPIKNKDDEFNVSKLVGEAFCDDFKVHTLAPVYHTALFNACIDSGDANWANSYFLEELEEMPSRTPIANGNIQARLRMTHLYDIASRRKGLVMSTDNQTEYQLGFWTIHGDVGDFDPLQDLWKTEVYGLAEWLCEYTKEEHDKLLERKYSSTLDIEFAMDRYHALKASIALTPTDGLGISNSDLEQIGAKSYDEVDDILDSLLEFYPSECDGDRIAFDIMARSLIERYGEDIVTSVWKRHTTSKFKRERSPMYICRSRYE